jgi:hypothetical protein
MRSLQNNRELLENEISSFFPFFRDNFRLPRPGCTDPSSRIRIRNTIKTIPWTLVLTFVIRKPVQSLECAPRFVIVTLFVYKKIICSTDRQGEITYCTYTDRHTHTQTYTHTHTVPCSLNKASVLPKSCFGDQLHQRAVGYTLITVKEWSNRDALNWARICKHFRCPGIDSKELIPPGWESILGILKRFTNSGSGSVDGIVPYCTVSGTERSN